MILNVMILNVMSSYNRHNCHNSHSAVHSHNSSRSYQNVRLKIGKKMAWQFVSRIFLMSGLVVNRYNELLNLRPPDLYE